MSQQCKRVLFHLCDIVPTVWPIGSTLSNHWTARHCHFRPLRGRGDWTLKIEVLCGDHLSFSAVGGLLACMLFDRGLLFSLSDSLRETGEYEWRMRELIVKLRITGNKEAFMGCGSCRFYRIIRMCGITA
jgi:hypothetical protein